MELERWHDARALLIRVLADDLEDTEALCLLSGCHLGLGEPEVALETATRAVALDGDNGWGHRLRALAFFQLGRHEDSVAAARRSVTVEPQQPHAHLVLAEALAQTRKPRKRRREALEVARHGVALAPNEAETHATLGAVALVCREWDTSERASRKALEIDPELTRARNNLAGVELVKRRYGFAASGYVATLAGEPSYGIASDNMKFVAWNLLWAAHLAVLPGVFAVLGLVWVQAEGWKAAPTLRALLGVVLVVVWLLLVRIAFRGMPAAATRDLVRLPRRNVTTAVLTAGVAMGAAGTLAAVWLPLSPAVAALGLAFLGIVPSFATASIFILRNRLQHPGV